MAGRAGGASVASLAFVAAVALLSPVVPTAAAAPSTAVHCGETVTTDVKLTSDLTCTTNGLTVGADNIEIDLSGHSITAAAHGPLSCFEGPSPGPCFGIDTNEHSGMTIRSGRIDNFDTNIGGIVSYASSHVRVYGITTTHPTSGDIGVGDDSVLAFNRISGHVTVRSRSTAVANRGGPNSELIAFNGDHDRFERNAVANIVLTFATDSYIGGNLLVGGSNSSLGIELIARSDSNVVTGNLLLRNHIVVGGSAFNLIADNIVLGTPPLVDGIHVGFESARGISDHDTIRHNSVFRAANDGIVVENSFGGGHIDVSDNVTSFNGHDGIENGDVSTTLTRNAANHNANLGIESVAGAIDGGGNTASANGNPAQCTNIACG